MPRDVACLLDILEAAKLAAAYVSTKTKEEFLRDTQCQDVVIRRLEIIGEAGAERAQFCDLVRSAAQALLAVREKPHRKECYKA